MQFLLTRRFALDLSRRLANAKITKTLPRHHPTLSLGGDDRGVLAVGQYTSQQTMSCRRWTVWSLNSPRSVGHPSGRSQLLRSLDTTRLLVRRHTDINRSVSYPSRTHYAGSRSKATRHIGARHLDHATHSTLLSSSGSLSPHSRNSVTRFLSTLLTQFLTVPQGYETISCYQIMLGWLVISPDPLSSGELG